MLATCTPRPQPVNRGFGSVTFGWDPWVGARMSGPGKHDVFGWALQEHPDTVGGAMLTGLREAVRALHLLRGDSEAAGTDAADAIPSEAPRKRKATVRQASTS